MATLDAPSQVRIMTNMQMEKSTALKIVPPSRSSRTTVRPKMSVDWGRYDLWNSAVFGYFFGEHQLARLVYIDVDEEVLTQLAPDSQSEEEPVQDFIQALRKTLDIRSNHLVDNHIDRLTQWKQGGASAPPPFIAVLALFCLAAQRMQSDTSFTANNYYDRLAQLLIGDSYSPAERKALSSGLPKADRFWRELEAWLWSQRGRYGNPSAQPMYKWAHVGWPLSQALLRSHDRQRLPEFFREAGLEGGQEIPGSDMERMISAWIHASPLSQAAKASWNDGTARRKMSEIVSLELSMWDGTMTASQQANGHTPSRQIILEASLLYGPRPRINWGVVLPMPSGSASATFDLGEEGSRLYTEPQITVYRGLSDRWSEPVSDVLIEHLLMNPVRMVAAEGGYECHWQPRKVVILAWDDEFQAYRSRPHLEFGRRSIVLAYRTAAADVESVLGPVHDGGINRVPDSWGVPEGWVVFKDVRLTARPDTGGAYDLDCLEPETSSSIEWSGGISLPGKRRWLPTRLPTVGVSVEEAQRLTISVLCKASFDYTGEPWDYPPFKSVGSSAHLDLATLGLLDGLYGLTVTAYNSPRDDVGEEIRHTFEVRSPDSAEPSPADWLLHRPDSKQWGLSASWTSDEPGSSTVGVAGALVWPSSGLRLRPKEPSQVPDSGIGSAWEAVEEDLSGSTKRVGVSLSNIADCFRGAHHFVLPDVKDMSDYHRRLTKGVCKRCGLRQTYRAYRALRKSNAERGAQQAGLGKPTYSGSQIPATRPPALQAPDYDGLLEACCTLGAGPWSHFELLARQSSDSFPQEAAQVLSALGYLDLELNVTGTRIVRWQVAPSVLVTTAPGHVLWTGHRSGGLRETIRIAAQELGGALVEESNRDGPISYWVSGLNPNALDALVETVNQRVSKHLHISRRPDLAIAESLPPLQNTLAAGHEVSKPKVGAYFDVGKAVWVPVASAGTDGLYRTDSSPRSYILKRGSTWHDVSYRVGKHLAAALAGSSLLVYDSQTQQLATPLGARLPGLYERAVVLSSVLPPIVDRGRVIYRQVPVAIAAPVWTAVCGDNTT